MLEQLESTRERIGGLFPKLPTEVAVVVHSSGAALDLAQPFLPVMRRITTPAARRYLAGWPARATLHVLTPRLLAERAANLEGSREMLALTPSALYAQLVVAESNPDLPPPWTLRSTSRAATWAWLVAGSAQWFSGQTAHARPAIARRLREGRRPEFPPGLRDAVLLGGTVVDLVAREEGVASAVRLACSLPRGGPREALIATFGGRAMVHTEGTWRAHLSRMAGR
ncbi:MAG TPA: hypothetical protein VMY78_00040 [Solirubrobacteraceae bacterium]|nr:hypothetical protein [Solirubrobacteraceae bacterium]